MRRLIEAALGNRVLPNLLMIALLFAGAFSIANLTIKNFPEITTGAVSVTVAFPGASPQEVSDGIIEPIENEIRSLDGVRKITGTARQSVGVVTVDILRSADVATVRDDIETAIAGITVFPSGSEDPVVTEVDAPELAIQYILAGNMDPATLKDLAQTAREELLAQEGISTVEISGVPVDEIGIEIDRATLESFGLSLNDIAARITAENLDLSGGTLRSSDTRLQIRALGERETGADLRSIALFEDENGAVLRLGDIAEIDDGLAEEAVSAQLNGAPGVYISVFRNGNEQILDLVETTRTYIQQDFVTTLPNTVEIVEWRNEADNLQGRIDLLIKNAAIGGGLILLLLTLFLDLRIALWVSVGIAVSFVGAFALMLAFGVTINQLSLFGFILALGIVVDDAIVVGEAIYARRKAGDAGLSAAKAGAARMAPPVFFAVATSIAAFTPLLFLPGTSGSFIAPIAAVVIFVLLMSLVESFFILPQHLAHLSTDDPRRYSPRRVTDALRNRIGGALDRFSDGPVRKAAAFSARQPLFVILTCIGILVASFALLASGTVRVVFFPEIEGNFIASTVELPSGTGSERTQDVAGNVAEAANRAAETLAQDLGVEPGQIIQATAIAVGFAPGTGDPESGGSGSPNRATVDIKIEDAETRTFAAERLENLWRQEVGDVPGARQLSFSASLVGVGAPVSLQVSAASEEAREAAVQRITEALQNRDGVFAVRNSAATSAQEVQITRTAEAEALGVSLAQIAEAVRGAVFGIVATELIRDREEIELRVRLPENERETLADIAAFRVQVGDAQVPLSTLARLDLAPAPTVLTRIDAREITTVEADVDTALTSGTAETSYITGTVLPEIQTDHPDVQISLGGEQEEQQRFGAALGQNFLLALFVMYSILALAFQSFSKPFLMLLTVPFGIIGALGGHALLGLNLTLLSMFGIIGLSGIMINASLLIVNEFEQRRAENSDADVIDVISASIAARFRPIFLTTTTTFLGITPLILEQSLQAQFLIPTAVSLGFGILVGSVIVILLMPAYLRTHEWLADHVAKLGIAPEGQGDKTAEAQ
ncbi:efflux RND transporter permease subunit [Marivita hallyeonensis]|uniref:Multidrug efflux pump subunit AcrB n=1 Tax=Marivita hallyeonensis TaxID=996342 RepID=A0A1M5X1F7_9RHOB|nr:efflux RND transporter permease subunit [Marivita hallyeonensis]SHH93716.1 Multidrug efflux pump subunit AcrB [Marivita hallyeonensis]